MNKILLTMAAVSAAAIAAPAAAQYQRPYSADVGVEARIDQLGARIDAGVREGTISAQEASSLRMQLAELERLERRFSRGGISVAERTELQQRTRALRQQIGIADGRMGGYGRDGDRWGQRDDRDGRDCPPGLGKRDNGCMPPGQVGRDGRWEDRRNDRDARWEDRRDERDERDGRWADREDRNQDGYDDRDLNRDGRIDGADDRMSDGNRRGGIVGDVLDRLAGNGSALRVGQRATANLGAVPYELRSRYRDDSRVYYRADRRNVYGIDARTNLVLQVYAINR